MTPNSIHPFPARMAPDLALAALRSLPRHAMVLDPMVGSGTVVRAASDLGHRAVGLDIDPLAVLMARVWTSEIDTEKLVLTSESITHRSMSDRLVLPWIDGDPETKSFIDYWFAPKQQRDLRHIAHMLSDSPGIAGDALRVALSRTIVTKSPHASLARDTSHSRPHRVLEDSQYDVIDGFQRSVKSLSKKLTSAPSNGNVDVLLGDARNLDFIESGSVDALITSPPYLNAIDYMRGHRLALVWLGYNLATLRKIRGDSVGAERKLEQTATTDRIVQMVAEHTDVNLCSDRCKGMIFRFAHDSMALLSEWRRVLRDGGRMVLVVGDTTLEGIAIRNSEIMISAAREVGFELRSRNIRLLSPNRRYLPPPTASPTSAMHNRTRSEHILTFAV